MTNLDSIFKSRDITLPTNVCLVKAMVFPVFMYGCEESWWVPKNWCFWTVVLEKTLESPLDCKEIQLVYSEGDQPWDFFGRNDAKAETPVLLPPHAKSWLIGKDFDAGRDWGQEEKGTKEDEMAVWHHWLDGCESQWTPGVGDGIQPSHPLSSSSPPAPNPSQHQSLFQWVNSLQEVAKVLDLQL